MAKEMKIQSCAGCPFYGNDFCNVKDWYLDLNMWKQSQEPPPPDWCPLREGPVVVSFSQES